MQNMLCHPPSTIVDIDKKVFIYFSVSRQYWRVLRGSNIHIFFADVLSNPPPFAAKSAKKKFTPSLATTCPGGIYVNCLGFVVARVGTYHAKYAGTEL